MIKLKDYPDIITINDMTKILRCSRPTLQKILKENKISEIKVYGIRQRLFTKSSFKAYLESHIESAAC